MQGVKSVRTNQVLVDGKNVLSKMRPDVQWIENGKIFIAEINKSGGNLYHGLREAQFIKILGSRFGGYVGL